MADHNNWGWMNNEDLRAIVVSKSSVMTIAALSSVDKEMKQWVALALEKAKAAFDKVRVFLRRGRRAALTLLSRRRSGTARSSSTRRSVASWSG